METGKSLPVPRNAPLEILSRNHARVVPDGFLRDFPVSMPAHSRKDREIKWEIFNKNIPFYGNIGVKLTCFALDSSVFLPVYPVLK
jgi:hypothetical protein